MFGNAICGRPDNRLKRQEALIDIQALVELASSLGVFLALSAAPPNSASQCSQLQENVGTADR